MRKRIVVFIVLACILGFSSLSAQGVRDFIQNGRRLTWKTVSMGSTMNQGEMSISNVTGNSFEASQSSVNKTLATQVMHGGIFNNNLQVVLLNVGQFREVWIGSMQGDRIVGKIEGMDVDFELRVYVPPSLEWITYHGEIPGNAVAGGHENGVDLQVCRTNYNNAMHPGKVVAGNCNIGWGGKEIEATDFEILINKGSVPIKWVAYTGSIPTNAVKAGAEGDKSYYVGQFTRADGSIHAGKVFGPPGGYIFNYGYGGAEITEKSNFRILVQGK